MYLERHRAVQTSQSRTKRNFRISEHLIREAEYVSTLASIQTSYSYPKQARPLTSSDQLEFHAYPI